MSTADLLLKVKLLASTFAFTKSSDSDAVVGWADEGDLGADAFPSGFKGDAGGGWAHPSVAIGAADLDLSPFGVFPASQATKTIPGVWKGRHKGWPINAFWTPAGP